MLKCKKCNRTKPMVLNFVKCIDTVTKEVTLICHTCANNHKATTFTQQTRDYPDKKVKRYY